jgi:transposase
LFHWSSAKLASIDRSTSSPCNSRYASPQRSIATTSGPPDATELSRAFAAPPTPISRDRLEANLRLIDALTDEVAEAERQLRQLFRGDERVRRLMAIPGVGFITSVVVVTEVRDITRSPRRTGCVPGRA